MRKVQYIEAGSDTSGQHIRTRKRPLGDREKLQVKTSKA